MFAAVFKIHFYIEKASEKMKKNVLINKKKRVYYPIYINKFQFLSFDIFKNHFMVIYNSIHNSICSLCIHKYEI